MATEAAKGMAASKKQEAKWNMAKCMYEQLQSRANRWVVHLGNSTKKTIYTFSRPHPNGFQNKVITRGAERTEKRAHVKLKNTRPLEWVAPHSNHVDANSRLDVDACGRMCCLTGKRGGHDEDGDVEWR